MGKKAVELLTGGLDSTVALHVAKRDYDELYALSFTYGQRHSKELACAQWQGEHAGVKEHRIVELKLDAWGDCSLTHAAEAIEPGNVQRTSTPNTYVPARNMVFLSVAASYAEAVGASTIFIGVSEVDYSGYVDCREEFIVQMEAAINAGTERKLTHGDPIRIMAPFIHMRKADEVLLGAKLGVDFSHTWTCYQDDEKPCGVCDSCLLRAKAFAEAGVPDPLG